MDIVLLRMIKDEIKSLELYAAKVKKGKFAGSVTPAELLRRRTSHEATEWARLANFQSVSTTHAVSRIAAFFGVA